MSSYRAVFNKIDVSNSSYKAVFNKIDVSLCDFNFISDEQGNKITIDTIQQDLKHQNYLVTLDEPACQIHEKSSFSATLKKTTFRAVVSVI